MVGKRLALLVGVSSYGVGFQPLPGTLMDLQQMERVLRDPEKGSFAVEKLIDPEPQPMREAIERFFRDRHREDVLLFYFSGHGMLDNATSSRLYLSTHTTRKDRNQFIESSAVEAELLHRHLIDSKSKQKIVILDCCFSGAIANLLKKGEETVNFARLQATGTVVLASSNAFEESYQTKGTTTDPGLAQSVYTRYLVEGIQTGAAQQHKNDWISAQDLHDYAKRRFQTEFAAAAEPQIIVLEKEGYQIPIAKAPKGDPKLEYRHIVDALLQENDGEIDELDQHYLNIERDNLNLSPDKAQQIIEEQQKPYRVRVEKLAAYAKAFEVALQQGNPIPERTRQKLKGIQTALSLRDEDIQAIEAEILARIARQPQLLEEQIDSLKKEISFTSKLIQQAERNRDISTIGIANFKLVGLRQQLTQAEAKLAQHKRQEETLPNQEKEENSSSLIDESLGEIDFDDDVSSERGVDYTRLHDLLKAGSWQEADQETLRVMCQVAKREKDGWLRIEDIEQFPCADLKTIDQLWVKYSDGKFGFSVQKKIWQECGSPTKYNSDWEKFGDRVGWRKKGDWLLYSDLTFSTSDPPAHIPSPPSFVVSWVGVVSSLASRLVNCNL